MCVDVYSWFILRWNRTYSRPLVRTCIAVADDLLHMRNLARVYSIVAVWQCAAFPRFGGLAKIVVTDFSWMEMRLNFSPFLYFVAHCSFLQRDTAISDRGEGWGHASSWRERHVLWLVPCSFHPDQRLFLSTRKFQRNLNVFPSMSSSRVRARTRRRRGLAEVAPLRGVGPIFKRRHRGSPSLQGLRHRAPVVLA
jgi:hypothetical protein